MTTHLTEEQLALFAGGDLDPSSVSVLTRHVEQCADCREAARGWTSALAGVAELRAEPVPEDLQQVREKVLRRVSARPLVNRWWMFAAVPAICSAAAVFCWPAIHRGIATQRHAPAAVQVSDRALTAAPIARAYSWHLAVRHRPTAGLRTVNMINNKNEPPVIRMTTADPAVVILLQTEERTDSNENE